MTYRPTPGKPNGAAMAVVALIVIAQANQDREDDCDRP